MEQNVAGLTAFEQLSIVFEKHRKQIIWGAVAVAIIGVVVGYILWSQKEKEVQAGVALTDAMTVALNTGRGEPVEAYLKVAADHPGTGAGAQALLNAAGGLFTQGKYAEAQAQFQKFIREYSSNPFRGQAMLGIAACNEAQGKIEEALRGYKELVDRHPGDVVVPQAKLALARIYESQNKLNEAADLYKDLQSIQPMNSVVREAYIRLEELKMKQPAPATAASGAQKPAASPGAPAAATSAPSPAFPMLSTQAQTNPPAKPAAKP